MSQEPDRPAKPPREYEPPRVEAVLTDEHLAREVQYAGVTPPG